MTSTLVLLGVSALTVAIGVYIVRAAWRNRKLLDEKTMTRDFHLWERELECSHVASLRRAGLR